MVVPVWGNTVLKRSNSATPENLELTADRISDPLERLRYLRKHAPEALLRPATAAHRFPLAISFQKLVWPTIGVAVLGGVIFLGMRPPAPAPPPVRTAAVVPGPARPAPAKVWLVESSATGEVYSNGLRVDVSFATKLRPRLEYPIFSATGGTAPIGHDHIPRGILYHTTESDLAPFEESGSEKIDSLGHILLRYVRREHAYHYLIDRFGRVYRVVEESDAANHAGFSVWGDGRGVYVNLNDSFIGVAIEGATSQSEVITGAQITAARMLTELLRSRYNIGPENCVAHAQVSVNPQNMRFGNHLDWAQEFPFASMGLRDNYALPVVAVEAFGFTHDSDVTRAAGGKDWAGMKSADRGFMDAARAQGASEEQYRGMLRHRYQEILNIVRAQTSAAQDGK